MNKTRKITVGLIAGSIAITFISPIIYRIVKASAFRHGKPDIIAHRGLTKEFLDDTFEAFWGAGENKVFDGAETDVWRTLDGKFVVTHDGNPFYDKDIWIPEHTFDEIKFLPLDLKIAAYKIPARPVWTELQKALFQNIYDRETQEGTRENVYVLCLLSEYIQTMKLFEKKAYVEIKQGSGGSVQGMETKNPVLTNEQLEEIVTTIADVEISESSDTAGGYLYYCNFISFNKDYLPVVKNYVDSYYPHYVSEMVSYQVLLSPLASIQECYELMDEGFSLDCMCVLVTAEMVAYSHSKGLKFAVWTFDVVDNSLTWSIYYDMGVDAITTGNILYIL